MRIAVDLDGVIWDIMYAFCKVYNRKYDKNITPKDVNEWYYFPTPIFEEVYPETLDRIDEYPFIDENINHYLFLLMTKHDVKILTMEQNTKENLKKKLKQADIREGYEYLELIKEDRFTGDKLDFDFDIFIDDCPLLVDRMENHLDKILLLFTQPWNTYCEVNDKSNVFRVNGWKDVMIKIEEIEKNV